VSPKVAGMREARAYLKRLTFDLSDAHDGNMRCEVIEFPSDDSLLVHAIEARCNSSSREMLSHVTARLDMAHRPVWSSPLDAICAIDTVLEARIDQLEAVLRALGDHDAALKAAIAVALGAPTRTTDPRTINPPLLHAPRTQSHLRVSVDKTITGPFVLHLDIRGIYRHDFM